MQQVVSVARPNHKQRRPFNADAALEAGEDEIGFLADFPPLIPEGENDASDDAEPKKKWTSPIYLFFSNVTIVHKDNGSRYHLFKNMKVTLSAASEQALSTSYAVRSIGLPPSQLCINFISFELYGLGRIIDLVTNCCGYHVLQKALECKEEVCLLIVSELLWGDPTTTLVNEHASDVWHKTTELSWTPPVPPIFAYINKFFKGKQATLTCHETGSSLCRLAIPFHSSSTSSSLIRVIFFSTPPRTSKRSPRTGSWTSWCDRAQYYSARSRRASEASTASSIVGEEPPNEARTPRWPARVRDERAREQERGKALKEGGKETLDRVAQRMCAPVKGLFRE
ncbi:hypothetical protein B0H14DRAFT_2641421 [Mycena olivaceomarginata]|nr:hypothetical protein B0H14DRAFT_2641421 [Mycena olivaceomarginata]